MILYDSAGARGFRALWTIEEMGLDCELRLLPFPPRARASGYIAINPLGTVPALIDGDLMMTESSAIAQYLVTRHGPTRLAVTVEEHDYPLFLDFLHHADATLTFPQTVYIRFALLEQERGLSEAGRLYADWFVARLVKIERRLADRPFLCADRFTVADIAIAYALILAEKVGLADRFPGIIREYLGRMIDRPSFERARAREAAGQTA